MLKSVFLEAKKQKQKKNSILIYIRQLQYTEKLNKLLFHAISSIFGPFHKHSHTEFDLKVSYCYSFLRSGFALPEAINKALMTRHLNVCFSVSLSFYLTTPGDIMQWYTLD